MALMAPLIHKGSKNGFGKERLEEPFVKWKVPWMYKVLHGTKDALKNLYFKECRCFLMQKKGSLKWKKALQIIKMFLTLRKK